MHVDDNGPRNRLRRRAARIAIAVVLGVVASTPMAAIVDSGVVNIAIPSTLEGVYVNWLTGANGITDASVPGWDFNPYAIGSGTLLDIFAMNGGGDSAVGVAASAAVSALTAGATIGGADLYVQGVANGAAFRVTGTEYIGIKFLNEGTGAINYGYAQLRTTAPGGFPAAIVRYFYDDTGAPITIVAGPAVLISAVSRRTHGVTGTFDLPLSLVATSPTTEPRQGPLQTVVFTFNNAILGASATITEGTAVAAGPTISGNIVTVDLAGVADQQYVTLSLTNLSDAAGGTGGTASARIGFLAGDVNQSRVVTIADAGLVNAQLAQPVTAANFVDDVNASGTLTLTDKGITNGALTHSLPAP